MLSLNQCQFIGRLGADPDCRSTQAGKDIVGLNLAVSQTWKDKQSGERKEATEWVRAVIFSEGLAKVAKDYLHKGSRVFISGEMKTRKWQDKDGADRYSTEIVLQGYSAQLILLDVKSDDGSRQGGGEDDSHDTGSRKARTSAPSAAPDDLDDDQSIPF